MHARSLAALTLTCLVHACGGPSPDTPTVPVVPVDVAPRRTTPWLSPVVTPLPDVPLESAPEAIVPQRMHRPDDDDAAHVVALPTGTVVLDASGNLAYRDREGHVRVTARLAASLSEGGEIMARSVNGQRLLVRAASAQEDEQGVAIVSLDADRVVRFPRPLDAPAVYAANPHVTRLAVLTSEGEMGGEHTLRVYDHRGATICTAYPESDARALFFSPSGARLFVHGWSSLQVIDPETCELVTETDARILELALSPAGDQLLSLEGGSLVVRGPEDGVARDRRPLPQGARGIVHDPHGTCFALHGDRKITVLRAADGRVLTATREMPRPPLALSDGCTRARVGQVMARVQVIDLTTGEAGEEPIEAWDGPSPIDLASLPVGGFHSTWAVALDPASERAYVGSRRDAVVITPTSAQRTLDGATEIVLGPDGRARTVDTERVLRDVASGEGLGDARVYHLDEHGRYALVAPPGDEEEAGRTAWVADLVTGARGAALDRPLALFGMGTEESSAAVELSEDGRYLAYTEYDAGHVVFDTRSGRTAMRFDEGELEGLTFVGAALVLSTAEGTFVQRLPRGPRTRIAPAGEPMRLATGSFVGTRADDAPTTRFVHVGTRQRRDVESDRVRPLAQGRVVASLEEGGFAVVDLASGAQSRFAGRFVLASSDGNVLLRCAQGVLRVHGLTQPMMTDVDGEARGDCPDERARLALRTDGKVLVQRGLSEVMLTRLDDGTRVRVRVLSLGEGEVVAYAVDDDGGVVVLAGDASVLRRRASGPALTAALGPVTPSEETARRLRRVLGP